jgi:hypothetical protein
MAVLILAALLTPFRAQATGIPDLPGLLDVNVCFSNGDVSYCGGATQSQLMEPPHRTETYVAAGPTGNVTVGLARRSGAWGAGDDEYLIGLALPSGGNYWLDAVFLFFDASQASRWVSPNAIVLAEVEYLLGFGPADLSRLLEPIGDGGYPPRDPVGLQGGFLVFSFSAVPEPSSLALLGLAVAMLACRGVRT